MFEREHHQRIATVLHGLDAELLMQHRCLFGGGTAMALRYGEYRESVDIDFLVSDRDGYRALRQLATGVDGVTALARRPPAFVQRREVRADQYGLRTMVAVDGVAIKFEIVLEGRMTLDSPAEEDRLCGVAALTPLDMAAGKLLANSDRWMDDSVFSRDLIDLAMMSAPRALLDQAMHKARTAYGDSVERDLHRAIERLKERPHRLDECLKALQVTAPKALVWDRIRRLVARRRPPPSAPASDATQR